MGYPVWQNPSGDLGKIAELEVYNYTFLAEDPDGDTVTFTIIAGRLPPGIQLYETGFVYGQPVDETIYLTGVPSTVSRDKDYKFTIRATTPGNYVTDRTFSLTVTGNNPPQLLTGMGNPPPVTLGSYLDGDELSIQLEALDLDIGDTLTWRVIDGELPTGVSLSTSGLINGVVRPYVDLPEGADTGWDRSRWEEYPWQFSTRSVNKNYTFTVEVTDGKLVDIRKFIIYIYSHNLIRADNSILTSDAGIFTADIDEKRPPILLTKDLGTYATYTSDNYFSFKFESLDLDNDSVKFSLLSGSTASGYDSVGAYFDASLFDQGEFEALPGLTLNEDTGWLTGYIPAQLEPSKEYTFGVQVYKSDYTDYITEIYLFTITILGSLSLDINWTTPANLGSIQAGSVSQLVIAAESVSGASLNYTLQNGGRLPQGLILLNDGSISGRCSFQSFSIDSGTCTFDVGLTERGFASAPTVFDRDFTFTVVATNSAGSASSQREFTLAVDIRTPEPYENLYVRCFPDNTSRNKLFSILDNSDIFPNNLMYRSNDPFWGKRRDLTALIAYGITASSAADYISAMQDRHYDKRFFFGDYGVSIAKDTNDNIIYEVVWVDLIEETRAYIKGVVQDPPAASIDLTAKIVGWENTVNPNDYILKINDSVLMRRDLTDTLGITDPNTLPEWMTSVQRDGTVLGYVTKVPLAYVRPGEGDKVLFRLKRSAASGLIPDIKEIPFQVDRYILDNNLSSYFDTDTRQFVEHNYTTFDLTPKGAEELEPITTVDFAVEVPFNYINGRSIDFLENTLGGLDGVATSYVNRTLIFAKQEQYTGYDIDDITYGWERTVQFYDDVAGYSATDFSETEIIPGWVESNANPLIQNQRAGIWRITLDDNNLIYLEFVQEIPIAGASSSGVVSVRYGAKYGGNDIQYSIANQIPPKNVPDYAIIEIGVIQESNGTIFDSNATRFLSGVDNYQAPDEGDKYLKFPKIGVFS